MLREFPRTTLNLIDENAIFRDIVVDVPNLGVNELHGIILVHEHFTTSENLFQEIIAHFATLSNRDMVSEVTLLRYINFIKIWVKVEREKFRANGQLGAQFSAFCNQLGQAKWKLLLETTLYEDGSVLSSMSIDGDASEETPVYPEVIRRRLEVIDNSGPSIMHFDPEEIARQLTLLDIRHFREIRTSELLRTNWLKKRSPGLALYLDNTLTHFIAHDILKTLEKSRPARVQHWVDVGEALVKLKNFQSAKTVYNGLLLGKPGEMPLNVVEEKLDSGRDSIRLKQSASRGDIPMVKSTAITTKTGWDQLQALFDPSDKYRAYRDALDRTCSPFVLSLDVLLADLKACDENDTNFEVNMNVLATLGLDFAGLGFESDTSPHSCPSNFYVPKEEIDEAHDDIDTQGRAVNRKKLLAMGTLVYSFNRMQKSKYDFLVYDELSDFLLSVIKKNDITTEVIEQLRTDRGYSKFAPPSSAGSSMRSNSCGHADFVTTVDSTTKKPQELSQSAPVEMESRPDSKEAQKRNGFFQRWLGYLSGTSTENVGNEKKEKKEKKKGEKLEKPEKPQKAEKVGKSEKSEKEKANNGEVRALARTSSSKKQESKKQTK